MINLFPVAVVKHLMVTHVSNTLNAWILLCKTWMATENCYYKKLVKGCLCNYLKGCSLATFSAKIRTTSVNLNWTFKFSKVISLLHSSWLFAIYFPELYISNLIAIMSSMFCPGAVETVKSCIGLSLLLANLYFQVVSFLVKSCLLLQLHT